MTNRITGSQGSWEVTVKRSGEPAEKLPCVPVGPNSKFWRVENGERNITIRSSTASGSPTAKQPVTFI